MSDSASRHAAVHNALDELRKTKAAFSDLIEPIRKLHAFVEEWERQAEKIAFLPIHKHDAPPGVGENLGAIAQNPRAIIDAYHAWALALDKFSAAYNALEPKEQASMPLDLIVSDALGIGANG